MASNGLRAAIGCNVDKVSTCDRGNFLGLSSKFENFFKRLKVDTLNGSNCAFNFLW